MTESVFWEIIENAKKYVESYHLKKDYYFYERQAEAISNMLKNYSDQDIYDFERIFWEIKDRAYHKNMVALTVILEQTSLTDYFRIVRAWVIAQGKDFFEKAITNPELLVDLIEVNEPHTTEAFYGWSVADRAFWRKYCPEEIPDEKLPSYQNKEPRLVNDKIFESQEESLDFKNNLPKYYPKLCQKFGIDFNGGDYAY